MIKLWDGWAIDADDSHFILGKPWTSKKDGMTRMKRASYHPDVSGACLTFAKRELRETVRINDMTLSQALDAFRTIEERIANLIKEGTP